MKVNVFNERGGTVKIFSRLILKEKVHKKENLHLKFVLFHIFKNNHAMYIQVNAKIVAGLEFQEPLVKVEDTVPNMKWCFYKLHTKGMKNVSKFFTLKQFPTERCKSWLNYSTA